MLSYSVKRIFRSLGLFGALLLGIILASTFFTGVNVGADTTARAALNQQLNNVPVDILINQYGTSVSSAVWTQASSKVANIEGITGAEIISTTTWFGNTTFANYTSFRTVGLSNTSHVYEGLVVKTGARTLGANETYVWTGSKDANKIGLNSTLVFNFTRQVWDGYSLIGFPVSVSLKVVGSVELEDTAYAIASGDWYGSVLYQYGKEQSRLVGQDNLLIVSWEKTFAKLLEAFPGSTQILAYVDREAIINPWDISGSLQNLRTTTARVNQEVAKYGLNAQNNLEQVLGRYEFDSLTMRVSFFIVALPVFFVAWYVGSTVSDVSYNLRRREIGLLLTKGFSNGQLFRMFLTESVLIGIVGGLVGVGLGFLLSPFFAAFFGGGLGTTPVLSQEVIITAVVFSLIITLLSTFRPSRRASRLSAVDALKEYMYVEEVKPYKQRWPWIAFVLGLYKIIMFLLGIDLFQMLMQGPMPFGNIFVAVVVGIWVFIDHFILTYVGPLLFFWGFTKIFIRGSLKFQELATRATRFLGDLGALATRNVRRNPARAASLAFLIALIIGYSFQTVGTLASEQDYVIRKVKAEVGADINVQLTSATNISGTVRTIENVSGVASATLEYWFSASLPSQDKYIQVPVRAVDPAKWLTVAYHESEWFSGNDAETAFHQMATSNQTIILERSMARSLERAVGDNVTLTFDGSTRQLAVVGFFGLETSQQSYYAQPYEYISSVFWSYVPFGFYESLHASLMPSIRVLVRLEPGADGKSVASAIQNLDKTSYVRSLAEELETYQSDLTLTGSLNIQRIGIVFSVLAASVATSLVTLVSLQERKRETSIMNARGLSFKQLVTMLLAENFAVVVFAAILGIVVGLIVVRGNVAGWNATPSYSLVAHRMVFPADAMILMFTCLVLVFASTIVPVVLLTKRYISRTDRIVRL
jgi:ABC-type antimicrobial peptide transport system permease subunit